MWLAGKFPQQGLSIGDTAFSIGGADLEKMIQQSKTLGPNELDLLELFLGWFFLPSRDQI